MLNDFGIEKSLMAIKHTAKLYSALLDGVESA